MQKTVFHIAQMDCPSEENLIRMKLDAYSGIQHLEFDLSERHLSVFHTENPKTLQSALEELQLGTQHLRTEESKEKHFSTDADSSQRKLLWAVLIINLSFFLIEAISGWLVRSMGLIADGLDMLADALVYGISLWAVGGTQKQKQQIARLAGYLQVGLAVAGFIEVIRRFVGDIPPPDPLTMVIVSAFALLGNGVCLYLLQGARNKGEAHLRASLIFTSNDIIINLGVIAAAVLVYYFDSAIPDLVIGTIVFGLVLRGAWRILKLA